MRESVIAKEISIATAPSFCIRWSRSVTRHWGARFHERRRCCMVQATISKLGILVIKVQLAVWGDMHHHLASDQAGLLFLTEDLECETTKRDGVISFDLALGGGGEEAV